MSSSDTKAAAERADTWRVFRAETNMAPAALEKWLKTDDSRRVGWKGEDGDGDGESVGHASGRRIIAIKRKTKAELTDDDYRHMAKVVGYIHRHMAQRPRGDVADTDWRYSLMNWGRDPTKD